MPGTAVVRLWRNSFNGHAVDDTKREPHRFGNEFRMGQLNKLVPSPEWQAVHVSFMHNCHTAAAYSM